jgi:hypothetical protein
MRRERSGEGDILPIQTVRLAVPDCPTCKKKEATNPLQIVHGNVTASINPEQIIEVLP